MSAARAPLPFPKPAHRGRKQGFSPQEIATDFGVLPRTVRAWIAKGWLAATRLRNNRWLITPEAVARFVAWRNGEREE